MKTRMVCHPREGYRFMGRGGNKLYWERRLSGSSLVEQISCSAEWFYAQMRGNDA